ncbi:unnamed protein product [Mycena citricolor]|uniref:Ribosomal RNA methyltransferase FtsJ domain-containing protein n=1 Tax=Mycena citricolor TaxID=2018698 RepID=A0AAD2Q7C4_9AGAR|nr:unnamed protein product [Mycena citricolor]
MNHQLSLHNPSLQVLDRVRHPKTRAERAHMQFQQRAADAQDPVRQQGWFRSMQQVMQEIDEMTLCVPAAVPIRFLDLGCCPGGFTSYILDKNPRASGVGISLPVEQGGHACLLDPAVLTSSAADPRHPPRFELIWADLTKYQLGPHYIGPIPDPSLRPLPPQLAQPHASDDRAAAAQYDLVTIDGHPLRSGDRPGLEYLVGDRLLVSQLLVGLASAALGGTVVLKLSKPERLVSAQLMYLLDVLCARVWTWKPVCMHATRATFYVVGKGFGLKGRWMLPRIVQELRRLWVELSYAGSGRHGRRLVATDLDFIIDESTIQTVYAARWRELSEHIWETQRLALEGWRQATRQGF